MDPNANLAEQRQIAQAIQAVEGLADADGRITYAQQREIEQYAERLAELVIALDDWIRTGGFLPRAWDNAYDGSAQEPRG